MNKVTRIFLIAGVCYVGFLSVMTWKINQKFEETKTLQDSLQHYRNEELRLRREIRQTEESLATDGIAFNTLRDSLSRQGEFARAKRLEYLARLDSMSRK